MYIENIDKFVNKVFMKYQKFIFTFISFHCLLLTFVFAQQQTLKVPYICSFEDSIENLDWKLNVGLEGPNCQDQWRIDNLESSDGFQSLYISCDTGRSSSFGYKPNVVMAYRKFTFAKGSYYISFDWKCIGEETKTGLRAYVVPEDKENLLESSADRGYVSSPQLSLYYVPFVDEETGNETAMLYGRDYWSNVSIKYTFVDDVKSYFLVFVWQNSLTDSVLLPSAACIDNIQIVSSSCRKPMNLQCYATCDTLQVEWEGVSESYEINWRISGGKTWNKQFDVETKKFVITNIAEGAYDVRVRGICGKDTSAYNYLSEIFCFCPENHCVDYVNLDRFGVSCQVGKAGNPLREGIVTDSTYLGEFGSGPVDFGHNNMYSRHTVCCKRNEYDPRTKNQLPTIPPGELASVRIGNWNIGAEAERIIYDYYVDSSSTAILLLKYAMVLNAPGHGPEADSFFSLEILDEEGNLLGAKNCGKATFTPEDTLISWNFVYDGDPNDAFVKYAKVAWKDWTSVGIDLRPYRGSNVKIRLTVQDCKQTGHYGYAYFTLGCVEATIKNRSCGVDVDMLMEAPDGFSYEWFAEKEPEKVLSTDRNFSLAADDIDTYVCRVKYLDKEGCDFELTTAVYPRLPKADFEWKWEPTECKNIVRLINTSYVETIINELPTRTSERCESQEWTVFDSMGNCIVKSTNSNYLLMVPTEGATYTVRLKVGISGDACVDSIESTFTVEPIYSHKVEFNSTGCYGKAVGFGTGNNFKYLTKSGTYIDSTYNCWGCDSVNVMTLDFREKIEVTEVYDTICFGETYDVQGFSYYKSGEYRMMLKTQDGYECDSIVMLYLTVLPEITFDVSHKDVIDEPNTGEIYITNVNIDSAYSYKVNGIENAPLTGLDIGEYEIVVCDDLGCCSQPKKVVIGGICLEVNLTDTAVVCADDATVSFDYEILDGSPTTYTVYFDSIAKSIGFVDFTDSVHAVNGKIMFNLPNNVRPDYYTAKVVFEDIICENIVFDLFYTVEYSSAIIVQKFDNLLTIQNAEINGGYDFVSYQWYKNNVLIPGAIESYYFLGDDEVFSEKDTYRVELTRIGESNSILSCPMYPIIDVDVDFVESANYPIIIKDGEFLRIENIDNIGDFDIFVYSSIGQNLKKVDILDNGLISLSQHSGVYFLYLVSNNESFVVKVIL